MEKGDLVAGKYRVERLIGSGGMGQVVAARHVELGNLFAIKVLRPTDDPQNALRFMREAQAIARLQNEHVVRIHDVGETENGLPYLVMEHLDGQDLGSLLVARGALPVDEAVGAILEACEGLAEAHAIGIVHRDLKPTNLFLARKSAEGAAAIKVVDFGLAKSTNTTNGHILSAKATAQGEIVGTAGYLAPEQMSGEATPRSDVWSLGVCLYRLLTGKHPFAGKNPIEISVAALTAEFRPLAYFRQDVPASIEAVIARCLRKIPEERYAHAAALHDALLGAFSQESVPQSSTAGTLTRQAPTSASSMISNPPASQRTMELDAATQPSHPPAASSSRQPQMFAAPQDNEATVLTPRSTASWAPQEPSGPPPTSFTTEEDSALGALDKRSRLMLLCSGIALAIAVLFLFGVISWRRSVEEARRERERESHAAAQPVFPPPPPLPPHVVTETETALPVVAPPAPAPPAPAPVETVAAAAPVEVASATPEPEPAPAPPAAAPAAPKKPVKKKVLYETP